MNFYMQEHMAAEHRQEVQHEMEQQRLASLSPQHARPIRHSIALFGVLLIKLGTRLKQVDFQPVPQY